MPPRGCRAHLQEAGKGMRPGAGRAITTPDCCVKSLHWLCLPLSSPLNCPVRRWCCRWCCLAQTPGRASSCGSPTCVRRCTPSASWCSASTAAPTQCPYFQRWRPKGNGWEQQALVVTNLALYEAHVCSCAPRQQRHARTYARVLRHIVVCVQARTRAMHTHNTHTHNTHTHTHTHSQTHTFAHTQTRTHTTAACPDRNSLHTPPTNSPAAGPLPTPVGRAAAPKPHAVRVTAPPGTTALHLQAHRHGQTPLPPLLFPGQQLSGGWVYREAGASTSGTCRSATATVALRHRG
jgi:hypothetical protein